MLAFAMGKAWWAGRVEVIKGVVFVWKTGDFLEFAKIRPVEWQQWRRPGAEFGWTKKFLADQDF